MLSISLFCADSVLEEAKVVKPIETTKDGKKYEVNEIKVRINGKVVKLKFKRDLDSNKIIPQKSKFGGKKKDKN